MLRALSIGLLAVPLLMSASALGNDKPSLTLPELMAKFAAIESSEVAFTEERYVDFLSQPLILTGRFRHRGSRLEKHVVSPEEEILIVEGERASVQFPSSGRQVNASISDHPMLESFIRSLRAIMQGDLDTIQEMYKIQYQSDPREWSLELEPRNAELARRVSRIHFSGKAAQIEIIEILEANGDRTKMRLSAIQ